MNNISPENAVTLVGDPESLSVGVVSDIDGVPMMTLTKYAERIIRYDDGTVEIHGPWSLEGVKRQVIRSTPEGVIGSTDRDGVEITRPSSKLILEAAARQGLTIHNGGTR